jgi:hypothetical protein
MELLGSGARVNWQQMADGLRVELPAGQPAVDYAAVLKIALA